MVLDDKFASDFKENVMGRGMYHFYKNIQQFMPMLAGIVNRYQNKVQGVPSVLTFSAEDMVNLVLTFFQEFNPRFCDRLVDTLQEAKVIILSDKSKQDGICPCVVLSNDKLEVLLESCKDINSLCTTPHEFTHAGSHSNVEKKQRKEQLLCEIESHFIEKVFAEWLVENGVLSQEDYKYKCDLQLHDLVVDCCRLLNENYVLEQLNHDYSREKLQRIVDETPYLEKTIREMAYGRSGNKTFWGKFVARYIIGEMVAQVLYEDYQKSPVATSMLFGEYMSKNAEFGLKEGVSFLIGENYMDRINNTFFPKKEHDQ